MSTFGERLKFLRKLHGKTQAELGQVIGTSKTAIHNYEAGQTLPSTQKIVELAKYLQVDVDYLIGNSSRMHEGVVPYIVRHKLPLIRPEDARALPEHIVTAAYGYIDAPVEESDSDLFAVNLCKNEVAYTAVIARGKTDADLLLCDVGGRVQPLGREKALALSRPDKVIGAVLLIV